ncbi:hypothetical protein ACFE04_020812 [Oxalis oulophora]
MSMFLHDKWATKRAEIFGISTRAFEQNLVTVTSKMIGNETLTLSWVEVCETGIQLRAVMILRDRAIGAYPRWFKVMVWSQIGPNLQDYEHNFQYPTCRFMAKELNCRVLGKSIYAQGDIVRWYVSFSRMGE